MFRLLRNNSHLATLALCALLLILSGLATSANLLGRHSRMPTYLAMMQEHGIEEEAARRILDLARTNPTYLGGISRFRNIGKTWPELVGVHLHQENITRGREFIQQHQQWFDLTERKYGVSSYLLASILAVESSYADPKLQNKTYPVLDVLSTLAFLLQIGWEDYMEQLVSYMVFVTVNDISPRTVEGNALGSMGLANMPIKTATKYAVDLDGDGKISLGVSVADNLGTIANFLRQQGWRFGIPIAVRAYLRGYINQFGALESVSEMSWLGLSPIDKMPPNTRGRVLVLGGKDFLEYWIGLTNFWILARMSESQHKALLYHRLTSHMDPLPKYVIRELHNPNPARKSTPYLSPQIYQAAIMQRVMQRVDILDKEQELITQQREAEFLEVQLKEQKETDKRLEKERAATEKLQAKQKKETAKLLAKERQAAEREAKRQRKIQAEQEQEAQRLLEMEQQEIAERLRLLEEQMTEPESAIEAIDDDLTISDDDLTISDDDLTISDDDLTISDDDLTISDDDLTISDDDLTISDDDLTISDDDLTISDDDLTISDDDLTISDDDLTLPEDDAETGADDDDDGLLLDLDDL